MCGIAGYLTEEGNASPELCELMTKAISHRGPDDYGIWFDKDAGIALGHRRLSILDLSPQGHQPMESLSGRYIITYNGELYNFQIIKKDLENLGYVIEGGSDTKVLLTAIDAWGIESVLDKIVGMFAFAIWDKREKTLTLARDRMGEKPLYYGWQNGLFLFGSELKSIAKHPSFEGNIDRDAIALFLRHNVIPGSKSIYSGIKKLLPGCFLEISINNKNSAQDCTPTPYWSLIDVMTSGIENPHKDNDNNTIKHLDMLLRRSVRMQMMSDVPIGAFLSGGIDSSLIVAMMQAESAQPVKTFSIGFDDIRYDETEYARGVAQHLGTDHTELYVTAKDAMDVIPLLPSLYDEPFSDSSQIPTFLLSKMTKQYVTVSLSGDSGDELFCGYKRYMLAKKLWQYIRWLPLPARKIMAYIMTTIHPRYWDSVISIILRYLPINQSMSHPGDKIHKFAAISTAYTSNHFYHELISHWKNPNDIVIGTTNKNLVFPYEQNLPAFTNFEDYMMSSDLLSYLPDDILVKIDRAAMGVSLETRIPFLDHRVVEFACKIPLKMKVRNGQGKWVLRQVLYNYVPKELVDRPKKGFGVPIDEWFRGPLRDWVESMLNKSRLKQQGYLNPDPIHKKWKEHLSGTRNWQHHLWDILMFQAWIDEQV